MTHADSNANNLFAVPIKGPGDEVAYVLAFRPKSFHWKARMARSVDSSTHPDRGAWGSRVG